MLTALTAAVCVMLTACGGGGGGAAAGSPAATVTPTTTTASIAHVAAPPVVADVAVVVPQVLDWRQTLAAASDASSDAALNAVDVPVPSAAPAPAALAEAPAPVAVAQAASAVQVDAAAVAASASAAAAAADPHVAALLPGAPAVAGSAPADSDVVFSPRFDRPEAVAVAVAYGASRGEWSYITKPASRAALRAVLGGALGGTINNNIATASNAGAALDLNAAPIVAPWMKASGTIWNSCAAPATMEGIRRGIDTMLATGANSIQFDDAGMQFDASFWSVGDLSASSVSGFRTWVANKLAAGTAMPLTAEQAGNYSGYLKQTHSVADNADYVARSAGFPSTAAWRAYLKESVAACLADARAYVKTRSNQQASLTLNVYTPLPWTTNGFLIPLADHVIGEMALDHSEFHQVQFMSTWLRMEGKRWAPVYPTADKAFLRSRIAASYAVGATPVVPWDVYIAPTDTAPATRFFGAASDYADLFRFVRAHAPLFDGWQPVSRMNLLVYPDPVSITQSFAQLKRLADLQVPYTTYLRQGSGAVAGLRDGANVHSTYRLTGSKSNATDTYTALAAASDASLATLSVAHSVTPGLQVIVKANAAVPGQRVVHLVRKAAADGSPMAELTLNAWALGSATAYEVRHLSPAGAAVSLGTVTRLGDGSLRLAVPAPAEWSVIELRPV